MWYCNYLWLFTNHGRYQFGYNLCLAKVYVLLYKSTGWFFFWSHPEKFQVWNWSHPIEKKDLCSPKMAKLHTKKNESPGQSLSALHFMLKLSIKMKVSQALSWTFTFLVGIFAIFVELSNLSLLCGTSSILRTFLGGTSQKRHPVY